MESKFSGNAAGDNLLTLHSVRLSQQLSRVPSYNASGMETLCSLVYYTVYSSSDLGIDKQDVTGASFKRAKVFDSIRKAGSEGTS